MTAATGRPVGAATAGEDAFLTERRRLLGLAYRMLGTFGEAEDVVQEAWLRWHRADVGTIERPAAWLTTVTTRLAIDRIRARRRRAEPVGQWLPEPLVAPAGPAELAELADSLTLGFLTMLERLGPLERAVLVLAEAFTVPFAEIADIVGRSPAACRQIASRARRRLAEVPRPSASAANRKVVDRLVVAIGAGDLEGVLGLLAPEAELTAEGGPGRRAAVRPVVGAPRVARFLVNVARKVHGRLSAVPVTVNGDPGFVVSIDDQVDQVMAFEVGGGRVRGVRIVRNPQKLTRVRPAARSPVRPGPAGMTGMAGRTWP